MTYKNKSIMAKRKAFTLIELLIVIAIIGILFIVLVSKVDFATDKAKATGVQTDFRSFQSAFEQVAKENDGFNTFGWDIGDSANAAPLNYTYTNKQKDVGDGVRNSYDEGDLNLNGICDSNEVFTNRKIYTENWTGTYTLVKPGTTVYDSDAIAALESAINKHLDPKFQITISTDGIITMANGAQDPWNKEYHGRYLSNAGADNLDRGVIIMYSDGANGVNGSADGIEGGLVNIITPGGNAQGKDDYAIATFYTYANGYGEVKTVTRGFSQNQEFNDAKDVPVTPVSEMPELVVPLILPSINPFGTIDDYSWLEIKALSRAGLTSAEYKSQYGIELGQKKDNTYMLVDFDNYGGFVFMYNAGTNKAINTSNNNSGGYSTSVLKNYVDGLYAALESSDNELYKAIKKVNIVCNDGSTAYNSGIYTHAIEKVGMFLASAKEVGFKISDWTKTDGYLAEGERFEYFIEGTSADACNKRKEICSSNWWLRTAYSNNNYSFYCVNNSGSNYSSGASNKYTIIPTFVIG